MTEIASTILAMQRYQSQSQLAVAFTRQNADFQRQTVAALIETLNTSPASPPGLGAVVDRYV